MALFDDKFEFEFNESVIKVLYSLLEYRAVIAFYESIYRCDTHETVRICVYFTAYSIR